MRIIASERRKLFFRPRSGTSIGSSAQARPVFARPPSPAKRGKSPRVSGRMPGAGSSDRFSFRRCGPLVLILRMVFVGLKEYKNNARAALFPGGLGPFESGKAVYFRKKNAARSENGRAWAYRAAGLPQPSQRMVHKSAPYLFRQNFRPPRAVCPTFAERHAETGKDRKQARPSVRRRKNPGAKSGDFTLSRSRIVGKTARLQ